MWFSLLGTAYPLDANESDSTQRREAAEARAERRDAACRQNTSLALGTCWRHITRGCTLDRLWPRAPCAFIFDDSYTILRNRSIEQLWPLVGSAEQPGPLCPPRFYPTAGRPLVNLTFALNYHAGERDPFGYHVLNLILHWLSALLLWAILTRTFRLEYFSGRFAGVGELLAFLAALLWSLHPLQTESVIYVTQRTELLMGFCFLATLYCSLRYWSAESRIGRSTWLALATTASLAGMASKEVMVSAPLLVLLFERTFFGGHVS